MDASKQNLIKNLVRTSLLVVFLSLLPQGIAWAGQPFQTVPTAEPTATQAVTVQGVETGVASLTASATMTTPGAEATLQTATPPGGGGEGVELTATPPGAVPTEAISVCPTLPACPTAATTSPVDSLAELISAGRLPICICTAAILLVVLVLLFWLSRRRKKKDAEDADNQ